MNSVLYLFISNVFDVDTTPDFMKQFIKDDQLDIESVLKHPLLISNYIYCKISEKIFGIIPTKKDFSLFMETSKIPLNSPRQIDGKFVEIILNSFFPLRIGFMKTINTQELCKYVEEISEKRFQSNIMQDFIVEKWIHRFGKTNFTIGQNMFYTFINTYKKYKSNKPVILQDHTINPVTNSYNETIIYDKFDESYMTEYEKCQYLIYNDNNFILKQMDAAAFVIDTTDIPISIIENMIAHFENKLRKNVSIFNLTNRPVEHDKYFNYNISRDIMPYIPRLYSKCIYISSSLYPEYKSLSKSKEDSIHFIYKYDENIDKNTDVDKDILYNTYDRIFVNDFQLMTLDPKMKFYYVPKLYTDIRQNPIGTIHKRVFFSQKTYNEYREEIEKFSVKTSIKINVERNDEDFKGDFIIDFHKSIDTIQYNYNGMIPIVNYHSPYITNSVNGFVTMSIQSAFDLITHLYDSLHVVKELKENVKLVKLIYHPEVYKEVFDMHILCSCPFNDMTPKNNILIYMNFIYLYFWKNIEKIAGIKMSKDTDTSNTVIIIDNRANPLSVLSVVFTLCNLKTHNWICKVFTSFKSKEYYKTYLGKWADIENHKLLDCRAFHIDIYNEILKSSDFWKSLSGDKCLIIQDDGVVIRPGTEDFFQWDYVGAPWADIPSNDYIKTKINSDLVGNGGLSLRTRSRMIEMTEKFEKDKRLLFYKNINVVPEDVYFAKCLKASSDIKLPTTEDAVKFASEQLCFMYSCGFHKLWGYHSCNVVQQYLDAALQ